MALQIDAEWLALGLTIVGTVAGTAAALARDRQRLGDTVRDLREEHVRHQQRLSETVKDLREEHTRRANQQRAVCKHLLTRIVDVERAYERLHVSDSQPRKFVPRVNVEVEDLDPD
jgi:vacuolar-type H+-ATPase subunit I/STV1